MVGVLELCRPLTHARSAFFVRGWDSIWYLITAQHGWSHHAPSRGQSTLEFLPALPTIIRAVHFILPLSWKWSGNVASFLTQVGMVIAVWMLTRDVWGDRTADRATILLCLSPGAFVLALVYTEPLLIAATAGCLLALRKRQWVLAGMLGAVATLTSANGWPLILCCAWEALVAIRARRQWCSLSALVLTAGGIGGWFSYLWVVTGSPLIWLTVSRRGWGERLDLLAFAHIAKRAMKYGTTDMNSLVTVASTILALALLVVLCTSRAPVTLIIYSAVVVGLSLFSGPAGIHPRFVMAAFPLAMALAYRLKGELFGLAAGVSAMCMAGLLIVTVSTIAVTP